MIRKLFVIGMAVPYVCLCVYDLTHGKPRTGAASGMLALVNLLIYW